MAVTLLNSTGYVWGIASDELGIKAATFNITIEPEFREPRLGLQNAIEGWAVGPNQVTVSIQGEINGVVTAGTVTAGVLTGGSIMLATFVIGYACANSVTYFGGTGAGILFLTTAGINNERGGWKDLAATLQSNVGVTAP